MPDPDRKTLICQQNNPVVTGIDFVQVVDHTVQDVLHVFFLIEIIHLKELQLKILGLII